MRKFLLPLCFLAFLTSCDKKQEEYKGLFCPDMGIVYGLEHWDDVSGVTAVFGNFRAECNFKKDGVEVTAEVDFEADKKVESHADAVKVTYFIAIVDPQDQILAKQQFDLTLPFKKDERKVLVTENLRQFIPMPDVTYAGAYRVLMGFQLPKEKHK